MTYEEPVTADSKVKRATPTLFSRVLRAYLAAMAVAMVLPIVLVALGLAQSDTRNLQIGLNLALIAFSIACAVAVRRQTGTVPSLDAIVVPRSLLVALFASALVSLVVATWLRFEGLLINGVDFSIFDWMLNTAKLGRPFMYSPICGCDHFGVHTSYVLIPLIPLHRLFESPFVLLLVNPIAFWLALFPLRRLALRYLKNNEMLSALLMLAFITSCWAGKIVNYGFHIEVFFVPAGLWFAWGWAERRTAVWLAGAVTFLLVKEDGALYLAGFAVGAVFFERSRRKGALGLLSLCILFLGLNVGIVQRSFRSQGDGPGYLAYWAQYGTGYKGIVEGMLAQPFRLARDIFSSHWWYFLGSFAFLPALSPLSMAAMLPGFFILGTGKPLMHDYTLYYAAPLLPFAFFGFLQGIERIGQNDRLRSSAAWIAFFVLLVSPLVGGGYLRFVRPRMDIAHDARVLGEMLKVHRDDKPQLVVCAQMSLFPHLGYGYDLRPLSPDCLSQATAVGIVHPEIEPYPYTRKELLSMRDANTVHLAETVSGIQVFSRDPHLVDAIGLSSHPSGDSSLP